MKKILIIATVLATSSMIACSKTEKVEETAALQTEAPVVPETLTENVEAPKAEEQKIEEKKEEVKSAQSLGSSSSGLGH